MKNVQWIRDGLEQSGKSQAALARRLGVDPAQVNRLLKGSRNLLASEVPIIEQFLGVAAPEHVQRLSDMGREYRSETPRPGTTGPCYATLVTKDGTTIVYIGDQPVSSEPKPMRFAHVRGLYCFAASAGPMEPRFKPGELVWINPHRPVRLGDDVALMEKREQSHEIYLHLGELIADDDCTWTIRTHNPQESSDFSKADFTALFILPRD